MKRITLLAAVAVVAALLASAPVLAHVVESNPFAFLSRDHMTDESSQIVFSTGEPGTMLYIR